MAAISDFAKGVIVGSQGDQASAGQVAGDITGALVPGLGEIKAVQDIWEGARSSNPALIIGGLVGLIPVVGAAGKAGGKIAGKIAGKSAAKAATKAGGNIAAKTGQTIAEQSFKASAMRLGRLAHKEVSATLKRPKTREKLATIATEAGERGLSRLLQRLSEMGASGEAPEVHTRKHPSFEAARSAAFTGMGENPDKDWHDLRTTEDDGKSHVVGRHDAGRKGFRLLADAPKPGDKHAPLRVYWWKGGDEVNKLTFGIEECEASPAAVQRIQEAYLNRNLSFRVKRG